jgi:hypothetical protein
MICARGASLFQDRFQRLYELASQARPMKSEACRDGDHELCDGIAPKKEWLEHDQLCDCPHHKPKEDDLET